MSAPRNRATAAVAAVCLVSLLAACQPPPTGGGFVDEFNGTTLNASRWYPNRWFSSVCAAGATPGEQQWYRARNARVQDGRLVLTASGPRNDCNEGSWSGSRPYTSAWVQTGGSRSGAGVTPPGYTFRYGRVDVRFKAPNVKGVWPAIWLLSAGQPDAEGNHPYPSRPEIDGTELYGGKSREWSFHVHLATGSGQVDQGTTATGPDWSADFHTLSIDWRPTKITWLVDGVSRWSYTGPGIPSVPMYLIINLAVGGWAGPVDASHLPAQMLVDSVRISP
ncbi:MAG: Endo,3,4-beta-glycanase exsH [Acidimicrobiales bacterium]|nr:Endo,3,4-beta-glycanase exsH [Acidimicrobiales bacterium]